MIKKGFYLCNDCEISETRAYNERGTQACFKFELNGMFWVFNFMRVTMLWPKTQIKTFVTIVCPFKMSS